MFDWWFNLLMVAWVLAVIGFFRACWKEHQEEMEEKEERIRLKKKAIIEADEAYERGYWHGARG